MSPHQGFSQQLIPLAHYTMNRKNADIILESALEITSQRISRTIQSCVIYIHCSCNYKKWEKGWNSELEIANSRIPDGFLGAKASQSLSKYVTYGHNKRAGCLSNGIFEIIATKIEAGHVSSWPDTFQGIYVVRSTWSLNWRPNLVIVQEQKHPSKFTQQKQFCFSLG